MTFFFHQSSKKASKKDPLAFATDTLHKLECKVCPNKNCDTYNAKMKPQGKKKDVYILTETITSKEDKTGRRLSDKAGRKILKSVPEKHKEKLRINSLTRCINDNNKKKNGVAVECCRPSVERDIEKTKPKVIIGFGDVVLQWATKRTSSYLWRGKRTPIKIGDHVCWYYHCMSPEDVIDKQKKSRSGESYETEHDHVFDLDVSRAFNNYDDEPQFEDLSKLYDGIEYVFGNGEKDLKTIEKWFKEFRKKKSAIDIETTGLRPYNKGQKILTVSIGTYDHAVAFPLFHPEAKWTKKQLAKLIEMFIEFLRNSKTKIAHRLTFELEWFAFFYGEELLRETKWGDTKAQAYLLDERKGVTPLDFLCREHFGFDLKPLSPINVKDLINEPLEEVLKYNALDTKYTYKLEAYQMPMLDEELIPPYKRLVRASATMVLTQKRGLVPNKKVASKFEKDLGKQQRDTLEQIKNLKVIKKFERKYHEFNPASNDDVPIVFRDMLGFNQGSKDGGKKYSTDESVLSRIDHPLAKLILELRGVSKLKGTYIDSIVNGTLLYDDGLIHTMLHLLLAATGRLSSSGPNIQNFPKRKHKEIRKVIRAPKGHKIVSLDYGQIEARVIGMASKDKVFCKALWEEYDVHYEWAERIAHMHPACVGGKRYLKDKKVMKTFRGDIKNQWVFPLFFGAVVGSVAKANELPIEKAKKLYEEFWDMFEGVHEWQREVEKQYLIDGYVEMLTGRRRYAPINWNRIINSPIQGTAADIVVDGMTRLSEKGEQAVMQIHDDLTFYIPDELVDEKLPIIAKEMCSSNFDFINVPLTVEASIGTNWYNQEDVAVFKSTDFE